MTASGALSRLAVIDLTEGVAGPYATKLLAGFGADVVKVERPGRGDVTRSTGRSGDPVSGIERSTLFLWLNTGKRSVALDLDSQSGQDVVRRLAARADVLVESLGPGRLEEIGLASARLLQANPRLVITSISNFGRTGPYRDYVAEEIVEYAMSGLMHLTGDPDRPPLRSAPSLAAYTAGLNAYAATLIALLHREHTGQGQVVDLSVQESALDNIEVALAEYLHARRVARRTGDQHALVPWGLRPCRDGHVAVIGGPVRHWLAAAEMFEEPRLVAPPLRHARDRIIHRDEVFRYLQPWLDRHDCKEIYHAGQARRLAFGYLATLADVMASPQLTARSFFEEVDHPIAGRHPYCGPPFRLREGGWRARRAPLLDEHAAEVLAEAGGGRTGAVTGAGRPAAPAGSPEHPLAGIRIVDLTHDWAGPHATRILADFGAEVIKVEYVGRLDGMRGARLEDRAYNRHPRWLEINRNKLSVTLDLKTAGGRRAFVDLVAVSDVLVESSRVGVLERLGLGEDVLRQGRPDLVLVRMSPFGQTGPEAGYAGYGGCLEPLSGIQALTGYDDESPPRRVREMDVTNGIAGACAILTALYQHRLTGRGQAVDLSQLETAVHALGGEHLLEFARCGEQPHRTGNRHPRFAPHGCYRCQGDDAWIAIAVRDDDDWLRLCTAIGRPEYADGAFASPAARAAVHDELDRVLESWTLGRTKYEAMHELQTAGVPAGAVLTVADLATDQHLAARGFLQSAPNGTGPRFPGMPFRLSAGRGDVRRPGPALGEHNRYVLVDLLGWPEEQVEPVDEAAIGTAFDPGPPDAAR